MLLLLGVVIDGELQALRYGRELRSLFPAMEAARHDLVSGDSASPRLQRVEQRVRDLRSALDHARFTFGVTGWIPFLRRPVDAVRHGADAAGAAARALALGREVLDAVGASGSGSSALLHDGAVDVPLLRSLVPKVSELVASLQAGYDDIQAIPHIPFVGELDRLKADALARARESLTAGQRALAAAELLPTLFGADGPQTYFLALQNNADLRGTGGAVLGWGIVRVEDGHLTLVGGGPITQLDGRTGVRVKLPRPVRWYLHVTGRNPMINNGTNYSPNFPVVAPTWAEQVEAATGHHIDDVIALDPVGVAALLRGQETFTIPGYPEPLDASNIARFTEHDQYSLPQRVQRVIPAQLVRAAFRSLSSPRDVVTLAESMSSAIAEKRIQLWSSHPGATGLLRTMGWAGGIQHSRGDYLYLTDNKRNANKVDYFTQTSIDDTVTIDAEGDARVDVLITLDNQTRPGEADYIVGPWTPYALNVAMLDLYVPKQAEDPLVDPARGVGFPDVRPQGFVVHREAYRRVFTKIITAWPGHPGTLRFRYTIPNVIRNTRDGKLYRLTVQHQPLVHPVDLTVHLVLPDGSTVTGTDAGWTVRGSEATFRAPITRDLRTTVAYR